MYKKCSICGQVRRTTNTEKPYVCEPQCLRIDARKLLLETTPQGKMFWKGFAWLMFLFLFGVVVGWLIRGIV